MMSVDLSLAFVTGHPRAMALLDGEGRVVVHSRGWIRQEGPIPDLVGTPLPRGDHLLAALERSSHPDAAEVDRMVRDVLSGTHATLQAEIRARCGPDEDRCVAILTALRLEGQRAVCLEFVPVTPPRRSGTPESETPFRELVETLESVVFVSSPAVAGATRVIHYVSPAYEEVWGRPRALVRDEPASFMDSIHPEDRDDVAENLWRESKGTWDREFRILRPDGAVRWIHSRAFPVRNGKGDVDRVVTLATDVTPRHEVTEALRRSRDELDQMVDRAPVALILHQRGQVLKANRVAATFLGEDHPASVTRIDLMKRIHPEDRAQADPLEGTGPRPADRVIRIRTNEGDWVGYRAASTRTTQGSGDPVSLLALWGPHTPAAPLAPPTSPRATRGLTEDRLFEAAPLGMAVLESDGRLRRANARLAGLLGWNEAPAPEGPLWTLLPEGEQARGQAALRALVSGQVAALHREVDLTHGAGHRVPIGLHLSALDAADDQGGVLVLAEDLTEHRAKQDRQRQADRIASLGRLAGGIAHDFNNLMTVVTGHAELVLDELPRDSRAARDVREIRSAGLRAASLTDQLLTFSRRRPGDPAPLDLGRLLRQLEPDLRETVGTDTELLIDVAPGAGRVEADPGQMERLIDHLAANARDAMPGGGRLAMSVRDQDDEWVALSVTDTGEGIPTDIVGHIFEPFFTTRPEGQGTGLGLALVHGIVEERGGRIDVRSAVGEGTTISVLFPRAPAAPLALAAPSTEIAAAETTGRPEDTDTEHDVGPGGEVAAAVATTSREVDPTPLPDFGESPWANVGIEEATLLPADVLLVEDEESVLRLGVRILEREGFRVHGASTGAEAITRLSAAATLPDLVVADARLRDLDVGTFVSAVHTVSTALPVLLLSGIDPRNDHVPRSPEVSVLQKPFNGEELLVAVRRALRSRNGR
jgi:PAS domain S-box-containing protein